MTFDPGDPQHGQPPGGPPPPPPGHMPPPPPPLLAPPNNYLPWAIVTTLFCCLPLGIFAIVQSSKVSGLWAQGQYAEAQRISGQTKKLVIWSAILGVIGVIILVIVNAS